jgi:glycoside/pentoside/hexuronide:cation symporter, GPH family
MGFFSMGCILIGVLLVPAAVKRFGKKQVYLGGLMLWAVGDILNFIWGGTSFLFVIFSCMAFFGTAFVNSLNWALVPDTVDYGEWKTGIRAEGSVYTGYTFSRKISAALAGFLPGIMLTQIGYVPNIAQNDATLLGLRQLIFIWPCALAIIAAFTMGFFYKLNEKRFAAIIEEISQRKKTKTRTTVADNQEATTSVNI